jgi:ribose transport system substrate-binding protein
MMLIVLVAACTPAAQEVVDDVADEMVEEAADEMAEEAVDETVDDAEEPMKSNYEIHLGVVQPGPEFYYQRYSDSVKLAAESVGMTVTTVLSEWSADKEIAGIEDLIAQGVDAIIAYSTSSDTAQVDAQLCNAADIPLFLTAFPAAEGPGVPTSTIDNSFYDMGKQVGGWLVENFEGPAKILEIQGLLGQGIAEGISDGFAEAIAKGDGLEVVFQAEAKWDRSLAIAATEDAIASGLDFNMIFVQNEDMCSGVVGVLEGEGILDQIAIVTENGSDDGIDMIKAGKVLATCGNPPSTIAGDTVIQLLKYLDGMEIEEHLSSPTFMLDAKNINEGTAPTWDAIWAVNLVNDYLASK